MPRTKAKDALDHLGATECAQVLRELLERHKELRREANEIAESHDDKARPAAEPVRAGRHEHEESKQEQAREEEAQAPLRASEPESRSRMVKKKKPNQKMQDWIDARKRHRLSHARVQMARELGMNPRKLGKLDNHDQEPWKMPLREYISHLYFKRFGKERPDVVHSIEEKVRLDEAKKARKREAKLKAREAASEEDSGRERGADE